MNNDEILKNIRLYIKRLEIQRMHFLRIYKTKGYPILLKKANFMLHEIKELKKIIGDF